jgi:WXG100 family type VII secretion target
MPSGYDEIKLDFGLAEDMAKTIKESYEKLQDLSQEMQNIANTLEEGALLGRGGATFVDAIRGQLCPSLAKFIEKFEEIEGDIHEAMDFMRESDETSSGKF